MSEATKSIFDTSDYRVYKSAWDTRQSRFLKREKYYNGTVYDENFSQWKWIAPGLVKNIKPLYLPLARAVDVDAGIIPGGWKFEPEAPDHWREGRNRLFSMSKWATEGVLYCHYGSLYGNVGLKISDLRDVGQVMIQPLNPTRFILIGTGIYDDTPELAIFVETQNDGEDYEYAEVITPSSILTYRNGDPFGYGGRDPEVINELGFVPVVEIHHIRSGGAFGLSTFEKAINPLDELNSLATHLSTIIQRHAEPQWVGVGVEPSDLVKSGANVWFTPQGSEIKPLVAPIDVKGTLSFIQEVASNVKASLPELAFDDLREKSQIATATLELQLMELVLKIKRARPNYDAGLVLAMQMAGLAAQTMGIGDIGLLADEELALDGEREILPLDPLTAIDLEMREIELERARAGAEENESE